MSSMMRQPLVILGFGGHARSVADIALTCGYQKLIFIDKNASDNEKFLNFPVQAEIKTGIYQCFLAAGNNSRRHEQLSEALSYDWHIVTLCSPHATIGVGAYIAEGNLIAHHAYIGPMATIDKGCIINTGAIVEHECKIGAFSHISINTAIAGRVTIGERVFVGAGAVVKDSVTIGSDITIGAGATVVKDLLEPGTYVGTPARKIN